MDGGITSKALLGSDKRDRSQFRESNIGSHVGCKDILLKKTTMMLGIPSWSSPPDTLTLGGNEVHVWRASLELPSSQVRRLQRNLSEEELERAKRFHFQRHQSHFIAARGLLRTILGRYLKTEPRRLHFRYGVKGKPELAGDASRQTLYFNISHSHDLALYAITYGREIGVDVERIRPDVESEKIAERFFSPREAATLRDLPAEVRQEAFYTCWTRKEAYLKAIGEGITLRLDQFEVSIVPGEPAALLSINGDPREASYWSLRELAPEPGYVGALAVKGHNWDLRCWRWEE
jgi:4'-phosphopantetheinyl transferase